MVSNLPRTSLCAGVFRVARPVCVPEVSLIVRQYRSDIVRKLRSIAAVHWSLNALTLQTWYSLRYVVAQNDHLLSVILMLTDL